MGIRGRMEVGERLQVRIRGWGGRLGKRYKGRGKGGEGTHVGVDED